MRLGRGVCNGTGTLSGSSLFMLLDGRKEKEEEEKVVVEVVERDESSFCILWVIVF